MYTEITINFERDLFAIRQTVNIYLDLFML